MPQIAQQDYKIIAPKPSRSFNQDAAALGELKKAILNGIGFDCLLKNVTADEGTLDRILGFYEDVTVVYSWDSGNETSAVFELPYTVTQYQGLAAVQEALDESLGLQAGLPRLQIEGQYLFATGDDEDFVCVNGKYLIPETDGEKLTSLSIADNGPINANINITWEDAQKLIGLPLV